MYLLSVLFKLRGDIHIPVSGEVFYGLKEVCVSVLELHFPRTARPPLRPRLYTNLQDLGAEGNPGALALVNLYCPPIPRPRPSTLPRPFEYRIHVASVTRATVTVTSQYSTV